MYLEIVDSCGIHLYTDPALAVRYFQQTPIDLRLDLHGVLDVLACDTPIPCFSKVVCISYIGSRESPVYAEAVSEIQQRIKTGQIEYGVLVFSRGRGSEKHKYCEEGSKAWVNQQIPGHSGCVFIDDSMDHLRSTHLLSSDIKCVQFNTGIPAQLLAMIARRCAGANQSNPPTKVGVTPCGNG